MKIESSSSVQELTLTADLEKRVAFAAVRVGDVLVSGIAVWRSSNGKLRVFLPSHKAEYGFKDTVQFPAELQSDIEADVIAAYKKAADAAKEAKRSQP